MLISFHNRYNLLTKIENMRLTTRSTYSPQRQRQREREIKRDSCCFKSDKCKWMSIWIWMWIHVNTFESMMLRIGMPVKLCEQLKKMIAWDPIQAVPIGQKRNCNYRQIPNWISQVHGVWLCVCVGVCVAFRTSPPLTLFLFVFLANWKKSIPLVNCYCYKQQVLLSLLLPLVLPHLVNILSIHY